MTTTIRDDTRDYLRNVLAAPMPVLPPSESKLGPVRASWFELVDAPGEIVIETTGGSPEGRHFAEVYLREQLVHHGYRQASIDMERDPFQDDPEEVTVMRRRS